MRTFAGSDARLDRDVKTEPPLRNQPAASTSQEERQVWSEPEAAGAEMTSSIQLSALHLASWNRFSPFLTRCHRTNARLVGIVHWAWLMWKAEMLLLTFLVGMTIYGGRTLWGPYEALMRPCVCLCARACTRTHTRTHIYGVSGRELYKCNCTCKNALAIYCFSHQIWLIDYVLRCT